MSPRFHLLGLVERGFTSKRGVSFYFDVQETKIEADCLKIALIQYSLHYNPRKILQLTEIMRFIQ